MKIYKIILTLFLIISLTSCVNNNTANENAHFGGGGFETKQNSLVIRQTLKSDVFNYNYGKVGYSFYERGGRFNTGFHGGYETGFHGGGF